MGSGSEAPVWAQVWTLVVYEEAGTVKLVRRLIDVAHIERHLLRQVEVLEDRDRILFAYPLYRLYEEDIDDCPFQHLDIGDHVHMLVHEGGELRRAVVEGPWAASESDDAEHWRAFYDWCRFTPRAQVWDDPDVDAT